MRFATSFVSGLVAIPTALGADWTVGQIVDTTSGRVQGHASSTRPEVSEYLGIPFAKPPVGDLRWAAPETFEGSGTLDGTIMVRQEATDGEPTEQCQVSNISQGNSCPRAPGSGSSTVPTKRDGELTENGQIIMAMQAQRNDTFSEDCLNLNIWTKPQSGAQKKAVLVFIHGGAFTTGSLTNPFQDGSLIAEEQDLVMVAIK
jgi:cholinesterase